MLEELDRLKSIIRDLRETLWRRDPDGYHRAQEGVWETEKEENHREERNRERKSEWDVETERLCTTAWNTARMSTEITRIGSGPVA